jgi:hypothetical protein
VKRTELGGKDRKIGEIKDIIQNGVKDIVGIMNEQRVGLDDTIQNGIKETKQEEHHRLREVVQTVKNGIKETTPGGYLGSVEMKGKTVHQFESPKQNNEVEDVIENKVKETSPHFLEILNPINFEPVIKEMKRMNEVNIVLEEGIKETKYCELHSLMRADHIIRDGIKETWGYTQQPQIRVNEVVNLGIKETNWRRVDNHPTYLDNLIETQKLS